ncbi:3-oxoacyl-[acyl-carrier-protein] synthase I [Burkholderiales bacterium]|nr:3-oxoacyl-[acyl-carrier-protein] synthase I [Burkholderiales bacterium]
MTAKPAVVVTGSGAICGSGRSPAAIVDALLEGRSALAPIATWDVAHWPRPIAAEIADYNAAVLAGDRKLLKLIRRTDVVGLYAAGEAVAEAGFVVYRGGLDEAAAARFSERTGLYVGSGGGTYQNQYDYFPLIRETGGELPGFGSELVSGVNPMWLLKSLPNNVLCHVGIRFGIKGPNACITNHSVSGMLAIVEGAAGIANGEADRAVAIGHDTPIEPQNVLYYHGAGLLAREMLRPFDESRDGSLMGEGAGALMLESDASARARGAAVLGRVLGAGHATESEGLLAIREDGDGPARAMRAALADAGIDRGDVGMIVAHGNGTPASDASEALAILDVFGANAPPVTGFKWAIGHLIAAAGAIETVLAFEALRRGVVPGIPTLERIDPAFAALPVSRTAARSRSDIALVLSRGFGGTDAALVVRAA